ncbi:MAG: autotransporter-associated beta strand repeat-containing protein, partial [Verrucomicrobiota bacterium]
MNYPIRLAAILFATGALTSQGAEILKANNADNLNLTSSWQGGVVPGPSDIGAWTNNSGSSAVNLGADLSWYGVKVYTPGATPQINSGNKLTLGAGGIVLSGNNFAVNSSLILSANQNWNLGSKALFVRGPVFGTNVTINITGSAYMDFTSSASGLSGTINYGLPSRFRVAGFAGTNVAVNIQSGASFDAYGYIGTTVVGDLITANPKATLGGSDQNGTVTYEIGALGNDSTWAGRILNGGTGTTRTSIRKVGSGTWTLAGTNTYSGTTTIDGGTLALSGIGTISNTTLISLGGGATFDVSGLNSTFTLGSTQTLASSESATANLRGDLDLTAGAIDVSAYVAGTPAFSLGAGTLVLSSNTVFDLFNVGSALTVGSYKII